MGLIELILPESGLVSPAAGPATAGFTRWPEASVTCYQSQKGIVLQQHYSHNEMAAGLLQCNIQQPVKLIMLVSETKVWMLYTLDGDAVTRFNNGVYYTFIKNTYAPLYIPMGGNDLWLLPGRYSFLYIPLDDMLMKGVPINRQLLMLRHHFFASHSLQGVAGNRLGIGNNILLTIALLEQVDAVGFRFQQIAVQLLQQYVMQTGFPYNWVYQQKMSSLIQFICRDIIDNITMPQNFAVHNICARYYITRRMLEHGFKKYAGITLRQFIVAQRMFMTLHLLQDEKTTVQQTALILGYESLYNFSKSFQKKFGVSPGQAKLIFK